MRFPENYKTTFTKYHTINFPASQDSALLLRERRGTAGRQGRKSLPDGAVLFLEVYSAKLDADKKPVMGSDGFFVPDQLTGYGAMEREAGWGKDIPDMLRNEEWNYAVFTARKQPRPGSTRPSASPATSRSTRRATRSR